jgi:hypothetical protein
MNSQIQLTSQSLGSFQSRVLMLTAHNQSMSILQAQVFAVSNLTRTFIHTKYVNNVGVILTTYVSVNDVLCAYTHCHNRITNDKSAGLGQSAAQVHHVEAHCSNSVAVATSTFQATVSLAFGVPVSQSCTHAHPLYL